MGYQRDLDRLLDSLEDTAWKAEKAEAIKAKVAEAEAAGVRPSLIHESFTGASRQYSSWKRLDHRDLIDEGIKCVEDLILRRLQYEIGRKSEARTRKKGRV